MHWRPDHETDYKNKVFISTHSTCRFSHCHFVAWVLCLWEVNNGTSSTTAYTRSFDDQGIAFIAGNEAVQISYEVVDEILAADYSRTGGIPTIYILNPKMPAAKYMYYYKSR